MAADATVQLTVGRARLVVNPGAGGAVSEFSWDIGGGERRHWLRPHDGGDDMRSFASFPLVPFSNRIRDGKFSFAGKDVALPKNFVDSPHAIHGFGWQSPWQVIEHTDTAIAIEVRNTSDAWPWPWRAVQRFTLSETDLEMAMEITNESDTDMPTSLGHHPYFPRTPGANVTASVAQVWLGDDEVMPVELVDPPAERRLDGLVAENIFLDNTYTGWSGQATVRWPEWQASVLIESPPPCHYLVVFTPVGENYLCVEPVTAHTDAFNLRHTRDDTGTITLAPGASQAITMRLTPNNDA